MIVEEKGREQERRQNKEYKNSERGEKNLECYDILFKNLSSWKVVNCFSKNSLEIMPINMILMFSLIVETQR